MSSSDASIRVEEYPNAFAYVIEGSLAGPETIETISEDVKAAPVPNIILVLDDVDYINSTGFAAIVMLANNLEDLGKELYVVGLHKKVQVVFESLGGTQMLNIVPTLEEALSKVAGEKK